LWFLVALDSLKKKEKKKLQTELTHAKRNSCMQITDSAFYNVQAIGAILLNVVQTKL